MSKAEERALEAYPIESHEMYDVLYRQRNAYVKGYHQAEKDLELTWEDIKKLWELMSTKRINDGLFDKEDYEEVLKRFDKLKEKQL